MRGVARAAGILPAVVGAETRIAPEREIPCEDIEQLDILDADGNSLVRDTRSPLAPYEVTIIGDRAETLKVDERVLWDTAAICW